MRTPALWLASALSLATLASSQNKPAIPPGDWTTPAEKTDYRTTPRYDETMAYFRRIAAAAPKQVKVESFGKSGEGRELIAVIVSKDGVFTPDAIRKANRPVVLFQNAIHAGEQDGKDACMALLRDAVIHGKQSKLLERAVWIILPIYNADGHERFGAHNRINQNGPEKMGWRTTALNLNLNRDYMKADAPETRAFLALWNKWSPDFFVDNHVTDGADYQYDVTYAISSGPDVFPAHAEWVEKRVIPTMTDAVNASGHVMGPYLNLIDDTDPAKGFAIGQDLPRFSTGYAMIKNRPALLVELHMMKSYKARVTGNYELMRSLLEIINQDADKLVADNRAADAAAAKSQSVPLVLAATGRTAPFDYKGFKFKRSLSDVSGASRVEYTNEPLNITLPVQDELKVVKSVSLPAAYIIPRQFTSVIELLAAHGVVMKRTTKEWSGEVEAYRCPSPKWSERPFEGRHLASFNSKPDAKTGMVCKTVSEKMTFPAGSALIRTDQRFAKVAAHLLEPEGPDSLLVWGFFDAIFEQKEYGEGYVLETVAREMMAKDAKLKEEFENKVLTDREFAASPSARLNFFFQRSPYWDRRIGLYPVGRLKSAEGVAVE